MVLINQSRKFSLPFHWNFPRSQIEAVRPGGQTGTLINDDWPVNKL
jgi:hypothetical protein